MRRCEDCKIVLDNDVKHCPKCGKEVASGVATKVNGPEPIMDVNRLIAAASLHKFRSEWDEALASATDALRMEPRNPDVTLALGGIYEERGMLEEALVWYQMTLEIDENSKQGKAGQDRVGMKLTARRKEAAAAPPKDPNKRAKLYAIGIGAAVLLVIIVAAILATAGGPKSRSTSASAAKDHDLTPPISQPWARGTRRPSGASGKADSAPSLSGEGALSPTRSSGGALRTKAEQMIRDGLGSAETVTAAGATVDDVIADPRAGVASVTFSVPLKGMVNKEQITRAAVAIARKTFELHPAVNYVTTRCIIQVPNAEGSQVAFVGDIPRQAITPTATDEQIAATFNQPWWNPQIK